MWDSSISKKIDSNIRSTPLSKINNDSDNKSRKLEYIAEDKKVSDSFSKSANATEKRDSDKGLFEDKSYRLSSEDVSTLKSYGVEINSENLKIAAEAMKSIPDDLPAADLVGLLISRKITVAEFGLLSKYANGEISFSSLFAVLDSKTVADLKSFWGSGRLLERLEHLLKLGSSLSQWEEKTVFFKNLVSNFEVQELFSILPDMKNGSSTYFQWPIFWAGQDMPDTLEGEVFIPKSGSKKGGASLRVLVEPPGLGKTEIYITSLNKELSIYFGVDERLKDPIRSIFPAIREGILGAGGFKSVAFNVGTARLFNNFFSRKDRLSQAVIKSVVDLKA